MQILYLSFGKNEKRHWETGYLGYLVSVVKTKSTCLCGLTFSIRWSWLSINLSISFWSILLSTFWFLYLVHHSETRQTMWILWSYKWINRLIFQIHECFIPQYLWPKEHPYVYQINQQIFNIEHIWYILFSPTSIGYSSVDKIWGPLEDIFLALCTEPAALKTTYATLNPWKKYF